jgi:hypothetical protein
MALLNLAGPLVNFVGFIQAEGSLELSPRLGKYSDILPLK